MQGSKLQFTACCITCCLQRCLTSMVNVAPNTKPLLVMACLH
jgi:hypothetical protein